MINYKPQSILPEKRKYMRYTPGGNSGLYELSTERGTVQYVAITHNNISLVEVHENDVHNMSLKIAGCCGNQKRAFVMATEAEIKRWHMTEEEWEKAQALV